MTFDSNTSQISKFNSLFTARSYRDRTVKASIILHGDDGLYWVMNLGLAQKLVKAGYEIVK